MAGGVRSMFMPANMGDAVGLTPVGIPGLSEIRSVLGGFFFACIAMIIIGLVDGFDKTIVPPLAIELVIAGTSSPLITPSTRRRGRPIFPRPRIAPHGSF